MPEQNRGQGTEQQRQIAWDVKELLERLDGDEGFCELLVMFREDTRLKLEARPSGIGTPAEEHPKETQVVTP